MAMASSRLKWEICFSCAEAFKTRIPEPRIFCFSDFIDPVGIGNISEIPETETQNRHFQMPDLDGYNPDIADHKGIHSDRIQLDFRNSRITEISKRIWKFPDDHFLCHLIGKYRHGFAGKKIKGTDIIQSGNMIFMRMGKQNGIQFG